MEQIKQNIHKRRNHFHYVILVAIVISSVINLSRPDYNFVSYSFAYYVWRYCDDLKEDQNLHKLISFYYFILTFFYDLFLAYQWSSLYGQIGEMDLDSTIHSVSYYFELVSLVVKLLIILIIAILEASFIHSNLPKVLKEKLTKYAPQDDMNDA